MRVNVEEEEWSFEAFGCEVSETQLKGKVHETKLHYVKLSIFPSTSTK